jgi:hypothetical protein
MGTTPAAMPYLQMQCDPGLFSLQKGKQIYKVVRVDTFAAAMDSKMDAKEFLKALEERMPAFLQSVLDELGGVESAPEEEVVIAEAKAGTDAPPKPDAEEEKLAATKVAAGAELQALRAERAELQFSALHGKGNISTDEKAHFMKIAKAQGVDFAVEVYSKKSAQVPPGGERLGSGGGAGMDDTKVAEFKMAIEHATRFGLKDSNVIKHAASLAANQRN